MCVCVHLRVFSLYKQIGSMCIQGCFKLWSCVAVLVSSRETVAGFKSKIGDCIARKRPMCIV